MKVLAFFGSAREDGHTKNILDMLINELDAETVIVDSYRENSIKSCADCRFCWHKRGCSIKDDMQGLYTKIDEADVILIASPIYFHSITGELKSIIDRCQVYWASHVRGDKPENPIKKGAYILVGGAPDFENQFLGGDIVCKGVLSDLDATIEGAIYFANSDNAESKGNDEVIKQVKELAAKLKKDGE